MGGLSLLSGDEATAVLDHQTEVMEALAAGTPLGPVLDHVVRALEELMPGSRCSILLLDDAGDLRHGAAPNLPADYSAAIDGLTPGPLAGSCGTAAYVGKPVIAVDVTVDPRWEQFRDLANEHGLRSCWSSPIRSRGQIVGTFAVYHDVPYEPYRRDSELVRRFTHLASLAVEHDRASKEREARHLADLARQSAERANHAKSQFVAALSHELRTPLQAITGFTENLQTLDLSPDQRRQALDRIRLAAAHILSIVDDVLDLARVEAGAMPIDLTDVDLVSVVTESLALIQPLADRREVGVAHAGPTTRVRGDRRRLQQVVLNLVSNAVRFSPAQGTVRIGTEVDDHGARIHVIDEGPGIPAELLARLFVPFDRLGADAGREGGAGLGLVLARRLTEAMGGSLELASTVGVGTHVTVTLRAAG
jgi:signal transduction histidine kinase